LTPVAIKKARAIKDEIKANLKAKEDAVDIYKHKTLTLLFINAYK